MARIPLEQKYPGRRMSFYIVDDVLSDKTQVPPLYLQYNPENMKQDFVKKINRYYTFTAVIEEHWGEELDTITCKGSTGAFILDSDGQARFRGLEGLSTYFRSYSRPYFKFQELVDLYRNNGAVYDLKGMVVRMGYVVMQFDEGVYRGYFENFNVYEAADKPFRFTFDFIFKVENTKIG